MKKRTGVLMAAAALSLLSVYAAGRGTNTFSRVRGERGGGPGGGRRPPEMPVMKALDANGDGVIDAKEIASAAAALKTLDKNGDGKLTRDELMPQRPDGRGDSDGRNEGDDQGQRPPPPGE